VVDDLVRSNGVLVLLEDSARCSKRLVVTSCGSNERLIGSG
jgi:hypothetical protein